MVKTKRTIEEGEMLARRLNEKAYDVYSNEESIKIYADDRHDDDGIFVSFDFGNSMREVSFLQLEKTLEEWGVIR